MGDNNSPNNRIFVYGTLKEDQSNYNRFIKPIKPVKDVWVEDLELRVFKSGIPFAYPVKGKKLRGQIFWVSDSQMAAIRHLERGYTEISILVDDIAAKVFVMPNPPSLKHTVPIENGVWTPLIAETAIQRAENEENASDAN